MHRCKKKHLAPPKKNPILFPIFQNITNLTWSSKTKKKHEISRIVETSSAGFLFFFFFFNFLKITILIKKKRKKKPEEAFFLLEHLLLLLLLVVEFDLCLFASICVDCCCRCFTLISIAIVGCCCLFCCCCIG